MSLLLILSIIGLAYLVHLRRTDRHDVEQQWQQLAASQPAQPEKFDHSMITDLPEPARRFLSYAIRIGTPLYTVAEIDMAGEFSLGDKTKPNYQSMTARQILAAPRGFIWQMKTHTGIPMDGSDSARWTRFWLANIIPVARFGGNPDHKLSAFGRYIAEAMFWTPAVFLSDAVSWEQIGENAARATFHYQDLTQAVDVHINDQGQAKYICFSRWSDANPEKKHRWQPFGGYLSDYREVEGFRLPHHIEAGNMFQTDDYFPFFKVDISSIRFPNRQ